MKLSKIALSIVAALGVVTVGGSWYTGKQVEEKYQEMIELANKQFKQAGSYVEFEVKDLQINRHFFSSDATYRLEIKLPEGENLAFIGSDKIYHGPLPLNRLAKFNLVPVMLSMKNQVKAPEQFKSVMDEEFGSGSGNIGYSGNVDGEFTVSKIKFIGDDTGIESSPIKVNYRYDLKGKKIGGAVSVEQIDFKAPDINIAVNGSVYELDLTDNPNYRNLNFGKGKIKVKNIEAHNQEGNIFQLKDLNAKGENLLKGERFLSSSDGVAESVRFLGIDIGKWKMDLSMDFDAKSANALVPIFSNIENAVDAESLMWELLGKSAKFHLNAFSLEKNSGKFDLSLILNLAQIDLQSVSNEEEVLKAFSKSKFAINANREYMEDIARQLGMVKENLNEEQAKTKAKQEVNMAFADIGSSDFAVAEGDHLKSELMIDEGKVTLNGREMSPEEIQGVLFLFLMMGMGGLGK